MIRMSWGAGIVGKNNQKEPEHDFIDQVLALWDQGQDTQAINEALHHQSQADCERALHVGLERRRKITWRQICSQKEGREEDREEDRDQTKTQEGGSEV